MSRERLLPDRIAVVERRVEMRRARLTRHWREAHESVVRKNRWTPLLALVGVSIVGFSMARRRIRQMPAMGPAITGRRGAVAATAAALGAAVRLALSPSGCALWNAWSSTRASAS